MMTACELVLELIEAYHWTPEAVAEIIGLPPAFVRNLERVARKHLLPELVWGESAGVRRLAKLPVEEQRRYMTQPVLVILENGDELLCGVDNLTPALCRQVFDGARVRNAGEQRAWLETETRKRRVTMAVSDYQISGQTLVVNQPCKLSRGQLMRALAEMEK